MSAATLLVGFDSAWTAHTEGALVAVLWREGDELVELGPPACASFAAAGERVAAWQQEHRPGRTLVLLDQPTIVRNGGGQRPVERIVCSPVSARRGGMQPAYTGRAEMFGAAAPVWPFVQRFGLGELGARPLAGVVETYPVLALISWGWLVPGVGGRLRLPKYNPARKATFALEDWRFVCERAAGAFGRFPLPAMHAWLAGACALERVRKADQDKLDAALCLSIGLRALAGEPALAIGQQASGWLLAPYGAALVAELEARCQVLSLDPAEWLHAVGVGQS